MFIGKASPDWTNWGVVSKDKIAKDVFGLSRFSWGRWNPRLVRDGEIDTVEGFVVPGGGVVEGLEVGEDLACGENGAEVGFDLFEEIVAFANGPFIGNQDVDGDELAGA